MEKETRSEWLRVRIKPQLKVKIQSDALESDVSESQVVRSILVKHYEGRS